MNRYTPILAVLVVAGLALALGLGAAAAKGKVVVELDEAEVFIEWNSTDTDFGIQFFWDSEGFTKMKVSNERGKAVLDIKTKKNLKAQGLAEGFFESVEPLASELPMAEFHARFPEGTYTFKGKAITGERLLGTAEFTHDLPAPPTNLSPAAGSEVSRDGFTASFDEVTLDIDGEPIEIEYYEVVVEKLEDEPILQTYTVILPPGQTSLFVPGEFLEPDTEYKLEVIVTEESGNRTIAETGAFTTDAP
ncbi:MAG: fibronectin type III domain-containing protein [Planctomycetota bacterium]|jgi:hypothetical protein